MLERTPSGVGAALDSNDARLGRLQPAPANKISNTAEPIERSPAMFISTFSRQAVIRGPSGGRDDLTRIEQIGNLQDRRDSLRGRTPRAGKPRGRRKSREGSGS